MACACIAFLSARSSRRKMADHGATVMTSSPLALMFEKPTLMSVAQNGTRAPRHYIQAALAGLRVVTDDRERVGRRHGPIGGDVRAGR
jgi:hypothetical protein